MDETELLVKKCVNDMILLTVENMAFSSASVESAAMKDCILVVQEVITPFRKLLLDCIERRSGNMLPNAESVKYTIDDGNIYCCDCVGEKVYLIFWGGPMGNLG